MKRHVIIVVRGSVQGVSFRAEAQKEAERLHLTGRAENEPDGSVRIDVEGGDPALHRFLAWCEKGSSGAEVTSVEVTEGGWEGYSTFEIH